MVRQEIPAGTRGRARRLGGRAGRARWSSLRNQVVDHPAAGTRGADGWTTRIARANRRVGKRGQTPFSCSREVTEPPLEKGVCPLFPFKPSGASVLRGTSRGSSQR